MVHFRQKGANVVLYSPIIQWARAAQEHDLPHGFEAWAQYDFFMIKKASALWILTLAGWRKSYGLGQEIEYAKDIGREVLYVIPEDDSYFLTSDEPT